MSTLKELQLQAKKLKLSGYTRMRKEELEKAINREKRKRAKNRVAMPKTVEEASLTYTKLSKGEARKLRKHFRKIGKTDLAAVPRTHVR